jgi:hypothetical protein
MDPQDLRLTILPESLAICRLDPDEALPGWLFWRADFVSVSRTAEELSIVCSAGDVPAEVTAERDWRAFKVEGPLDFALTGILARLAAPLAEADISLFAVSTYDTDYLLVREASLGQAARVLSGIAEISQG